MWRWSQVPHGNLEPQTSFSSAGPTKSRQMAATTSLRGSYPGFLGAWRKVEVFACSGVAAGGVVGLVSTMKTTTTCRVFSEGPELPDTSRSDDVSPPKHQIGKGVGEERLLSVDCEELVSLKSSEANFTSNQG